MNSSNSHVLAFLWMSQNIFKKKKKREREIQCNMNELAKVAADSIGASKCVFIKKYTDGMYNKAYLLSMEDGQEVVAKVSNPKAGIPHLALFCGPKLYQPHAEKKLTALAWYQQIINFLAPMKDTAINNPYLWHNDLHDENIFVDRYH